MINSLTTFDIYNIRIKILKGFVRFVLCLSHPLRFIFWCVKCRIVYDELTQNENARQYEDIVKKGSANISIVIGNFDIKLNSAFSLLFY